MWAKTKDGDDFNIVERTQKTTGCWFIWQSSWFFAPGETVESLRVFIEKQENWEGVIADSHIRTSE